MLIAADLLLVGSASIALVAYLLAWHPRTKKFSARAPRQEIDGNRTDAIVRPAHNGVQNDIKSRISSPDVNWIKEAGVQWPANVAGLRCPASIVCTFRFYSSQIDIAVVFVFVGLDEPLNLVRFSS